MSQYRVEDVSGHSAGEAKSPRDHHQNSQELGSKSESQDVVTHTPHSFTTNQVRSDYPEEYVSKTLSNEYSINKQATAEFATKSTTEFSSSKQLEAFHNKQLLSDTDRIQQSDVDENYSKVEQRLGHGASSSISFPGQPRFLSGQSITQSAGPTPTLNQLLQASSPVHRFHSNYPSIGPETYQQSWPIQRPPIVSSVYPQPNQRPPQTGSPRLHHGPGGPTSPTPMPYQSYSQRFSSSARSHSPYNHHQLNSYTIPAGHSSNIYNEQRGWNQTTPTNTSVPPPTNQTNSSSQSPQRSLSQSPAPPTAASPQPQTSNQSQNYLGLQQRSTTPNTQGIDCGELSGQNSNDSSNGPAGPATPNSQGLRPTPSPTGSTGSRSMSPAVGQQNVQMPPRPSSSQSDGGGPPRMSLSPLATQGPTPHAHNYKTNNSGQSVSQSGTGPNPSSMSTTSGGTGYMNIGTSQTVGYLSQGNYTTTRPHLQFSQSYTQGSTSQSTASNQYQSNRPNNMHKMGFNNLPPAMPPSPGSPQTYSVSTDNSTVVSSCSTTLPGINSMGPPTGSMGPPPSSPNHLSNQTVATLSSDGAPMLPPSSTSNSLSLTSSSSSHEPNTHSDIPSDINITTHASASMNVTISNSTVTSIITTGPDGASLDEGSQQSTLSNASAASGEESAFTPKVRKELISYHSHPTTPQSTVPSPGAASINSVHEDYPDINSPGWPRTPASPVYSSHVSQDPYRPKKSDSLSKLYEMDDSVERRSWLDKLINFMEERRTPITSCPTISKNPLDLFRLYLFVKERGGFMEVTKNKTWKDIAGLLGIGASSSAAYTLRKHYTKHLLAYECHFDRGGVDPQPIINQVEAGSKKKGSKGSSSVPSPGSSNSQDSFPAGGSNNAPIDGYGNYQNTYSGSASSGPTTDYNPPPARPPSQSSSTTHTNIQQASYQSSASFQSYSQDQYIRPQGNTVTQQNEFNQSYSTRTHYAPYVSEIDRNYTGGSISNNAGNQEVYSRFTGTQPSGTYSSAASPVTRTTYVSVSQGLSTVQQPIPSQQITSQSQSTTGASYSCPQDYYRQEQGTYGTSLASQVYANSGSTNKNMPPPPSGPQQPRRHPDFVKEQQYSTYNHQRTAYTSWSGGNSQYSGGASIRVQYPNQQSSPASQQQHQSQQQAQTTLTTPSPSPVGLTNSQQWCNQQNSRSSSQNNLNPLVHSQTSWDHRYNQTSLYSSSTSHQNQLGISPAINQQSMTKREMSFPADSVEAITPLLYKRRKLSRADVAPVEAWRIMMALRSGLLAESCWALDVLNILLFDDSSVHYFGLTHLPGLLDVLLEHFSRSLSDMFDPSLIDDDRYYYQRFYDSEIDLGAVIRPVDPDDRIKLLSSSNYTFLSRRGKSVKIVPRDDDIFILDSRRSWDYQDNEIEVESWQVNSSAINYIVTCFESEVKSVSFTTHLKEKLPILKDKFEPSIYKDDVNCHNGEKLNINSENHFNYCHFSTEQSDVDIELKQQQEKKKKMKSLDDVLSRIKKEPAEISDLTREIFEKKNDGSKKEIESELQNINIITNRLETELLNTSDLLSSKQNSSNDSNKTVLSYSESEEMTEMIEIKYESRKVREEHLNDVRLDDNRKENLKCFPIDEHLEPKLKIRDPAGTLKRRRISDFEDESYSRDEASLHLVSETQDNLARRCVCLSTILRNLTFIPGNDLEFARNVTFLSLLGKLLLLHHEHPTRAQKTRNYDREEDADFTDSCSSLQGENEWWWDFLYHIRENVLVMAANIAGHMDLSQYPEEISRPVLDGLLHWAVCPAAHGQDPFPTVSLNSSLSPQRLALEALCKLCVTESNVDLVVATPPFSRLQKLCSVLSRLLCRSEEQVLREFGVNLLHFLSAADSGVARTIALQTPCVALLVAFIEQAENSALGVANQHGIAALRDNPESMGTSLDMLRRAAGTLLNLSRHPDNRTLLLQHESRLLALVMSQILDQQVAAIVARVLFQCSRGTL